MEIPKGKSKEEIREREYIIKCFYQKWKSENKSLRKFAKMIIMQCKLEGIGVVKLTVGIQARTNENVQYCITAIDTE